MIVLLIIGVIFYNYAKNNNLSQIGWILIGLASYFIPQLIAGVIIGLTAPQMVNDTVAITIISIVVGLVGAFIGYQIMVAYAQKQKNKRNSIDDNLLDSDIIDEI